MNKVVNSMSLVFLILYAFFAFGSINDLNFSVYQLSSMPFLKPIIYGLVAIVFLLGLIRIKRRWVGLSDMKSFNKFIYSTRLSKRSIGMSTMFMIAEIIFMIFFVALSLNTQKMDNGTILFPMMGVLGFFILESIVYLFKLRTDENIKIGVNKNLVAYFDREMKIFYFDGLQQISIYQNRIHFEYKLDLHMFLEIDIIPEEELLNFKNALTSQLLDKNIFFDESYRELGE